MKISNGDIVYHKVSGTRIFVTSDVSISGAGFYGRYMDDLGVFHLEYFYNIEVREEDNE
jgi:hypothetical protein